MAQVLQNFTDSWENLGIDLPPVSTDKRAHGRAGLGNARSPIGLGYPGQNERIADDSDIGIAVRRNSVQIEITSGETS